MAKKLVDSCWYTKISTLEDGKTMVMTMKCDKMPEVNTVESFVEGVEQDLDSPLFMGKAKVRDQVLRSDPGVMYMCGLLQVTITSAGPNKFSGIAKTEAWGDMLWTDDFQKDGNFTTISINGKTFKETWKRKVNFEGKKTNQFGDLLI